MSIFQLRPENASVETLFVTSKSNVHLSTPGSANLKRRLGGAFEIDTAREKVESEKGNIMVLIGLNAPSAHNVLIRTLCPCVPTHGFSLWK